MRVYKFGGASVKDANGVKNVANIIASNSRDLIVVISAMGKMTNAFEVLLKAYFENRKFDEAFSVIENYHREILSELGIISPAFESLLSDLKNHLTKKSSNHYNFEYDRIIGYGELMSTRIVSDYLTNLGLLHKWIDIRTVIRTDNNYRFAKVDWDKTVEQAQENFTVNQLYITQGFIGADADSNTTSLGREGSDYSAAILSYATHSEDVTIWKDVPGVLNADPRLFDDAVLIPELSYYDAIELAFFGAQVIHPKTIQPLKNKAIPLYVKSFVDQNLKGTKVDFQQATIEQPIIIIKDNQILLSIRTRDFSFVDEKNISTIFNLLSKYNAKVNLMQNGAISFSVVIDAIPMLFDALLKDLQADFEVRYNHHLKLITVRHYNTYSTEQLIGDKMIYLEQRSRNTAQYLVGDKS
ncbi:MAG: aspartate kinase [Bacteroidales bacterium]|nr:aspartate kinase [Bacteroidales bacterium]